ncbi:hypothetical protein PCANB_002847 [Pneumocystis canis]|nr:hypothetical protein PCANB_002847 [Pneumocystis canis]
MIFFNGVQRIAFFSKYACSNNILDLSVSDVTQNLDSSKDLNEKNVINPEFDSYYKKMEETMSNIETDIELHQFIEKSIFEPFKKLLSEGKINKRLSASPVLYSYPMLLHKAMKIFREEFRDYVAVVSIFERIKSHGPESFVLGCSSDVYNEELLARWEGWGDLFEIENLLNEMKINSVTRTKETLKILEKIKLDIENMNFQKKLATDTFLSNNNTTCLMRLDTIYNEISEEISNNNEFS